MRKVFCPANEKITVLEKAERPPHSEVFPLLYINFISQSVAASLLTCLQNSVSVYQQMPARLLYDQLFCA